MKLRHLAVAATTAALAGSLAGVTSIAWADTESPCQAATAKVEQAQTGYDQALDRAIDRARQLGITADVIAQARAALDDGQVTDTEKQQIVDAFTKTGVETPSLADLPTLTAVLDARVALAEAEREQGTACPDPAPADQPAAPKPSGTNRPAVDGVFTQIDGPVPVGAVATGAR